MYPLGAAGSRHAGPGDRVGSDRTEDDWLSLFRRALAIIDAVPAGIVPDDRTLGAAAMLFRRFGHRHSRDIATFLASPQVLPAPARLTFRRAPGG